MSGKKRTRKQVTKSSLQESDVEMEEIAPKKQNKDEAQSRGNLSSQQSHSKQ